MKRDSLAESKQRGANALPWAQSESQRVVCEAVARVGAAAAATELGIGTRCIRNTLSRVESYAASKGHAPKVGLDVPQPEGFGIRGISELRDADGEVKLRWIKSHKQSEDLLAALEVAADTLADRVRGLAEPVPVPACDSDDLLTAYLIGDAHIGMLAHADETGANFDLKIAERHIRGAVDSLAMASPASSDALIVNVGDFFHVDNKSNTTNRSGNVLDVDSRYHKMVDVGVRIMRHIITRALERHRNVHVFNVIGNHDEHLSMMLSRLMAAYFENEPRVHVDLSPAIFRRFTWGQCLIGMTHGHTGKVDQYGAVLASHYPEEWGASKHRRVYTGHVHHERVKEIHGCVIETLNTLAARDAWHASELYLSNRTMRAHVWHREHGLKAVHVVGVGEL